MLENLSYLAQIVGVILVVASLVYVARQLRQNTDMLRSNARQAALSADMDTLSSLIEHPIDLGNLDAVQMTPTEELRAQFMLIKLLRALEFSWLEYKNGILDEATWQSHLAPSRPVYSSRRAQRALGLYNGSPEFKSYFSAWLKSDDDQRAV